MPVTFDFEICSQLEVLRQRIAKRDDIPRQLYPIIEGYLRDGGGRLLQAAGQPYLWDGIDHVIYEIALSSSRWTAFLYGRFRLVPSELLTRHLTTMLAGHALAHGDEVQGERFVYFDKDELVLYVSDYDGHSYRLDGSAEVAVVDNGTGVLFFDDDGGRHVVDPDIGNHGELAPTLIGDLEFASTTAGGMTPDDQRRLLTFWMYAIAFGGILPAKPVLIAEGSPGSGKSCFLQRLQYCLHGAQRARSIGKEDEADFGVLLMRTPIAVLDDVNGYIEWLQNALCAYVTGASWARRKKYSDADEVVIQPRAFLAFTSKNPVTFRRDDIADRSIIIRLERREASGFQPLSLLLEQVDARRPRLFGEWLWNLNQIVRRIRAGMPAAPTTYRMADFARIALVIGEVLGYSPDEIAGTLEAAQAEREAFLWEADSLPDLLGTWVKTEANSSREVRPMDLFRELAELAEKNRVTFYRKVDQLARRLRGGIVGFEIVRVESSDGPTYRIGR